MSTTVGPGDVYLVKDSERGLRYVVVIARAVAKVSDVMTCYLFDGDTSLEDLHPGHAIFIANTWKASRGEGGWERWGSVPNFEPDEWPIPMWRRSIPGLPQATFRVRPDPDIPGHSLGKERATPEEVAHLPKEGVSNHLALMTAAFRATSSD